MKNLTIQKQLGLIEVLVTMIVAALGLMAIATFQSDLMQGSGNNKIRSEAVALAEQKLEKFRNNIELSGSGYDAIVEGTYTDPDAIVGTNASFTRNWTIANTAAFLAGAPPRKKISVQVGWDANGDGDIVDEGESVTVTTEIAWINPADSALHATQQVPSTLATPTPRQFASEDPASEDVIGTDLVITGGETTGDAGEDDYLNVATPASDTGSMTIYQVSSGSHYYTATRANLGVVEPGVIAVFLCDNGKCSHVQNHFGGVVHNVMGTVYGTNGLTDIRVAWSSSDVNACYNGSIDSLNPDVDAMPYECVYAGNCNVTTGSDRQARTATSSDPGCFVTTVVSDAQINERNVGPGGEFGAMGLLGVDDKVKGEQVCFLEDTGEPGVSSNPLLETSNESLNEDYLLPVTKRAYVTRGFNSNNADKQYSEGINRSYKNHNFLVVQRKTGNGANANCHTIVTDNNLSIAPREIVRVANVGVDNVVELATAYPTVYGTAETFTGAIDDTDTNLRMYIPEVGVCFINKDTGLDYVCIAPHGAPEMGTGPADDVPTIFGVSDEHPNTAGTFIECLLDEDGDGTIDICDWSGSFTD